ncbi:hypothetical protein B0A58_07895 [Flavobacterium branchiophilum NBRC 15030 = ATCC 35035]|uniref:Uncharacterized protein n=1 Tax=Flavobacterium branchiophilum TaxID=55197 RepID=A0A2H3KGN8_9FLAO|nr:hypothetical protein B0A58_07895 [Flavobacterium branchiophilum NBRC 15030 = ATCC 35035]PDS26914.1 hypothetical protein B0A77_01470 [Flavobacterium branchiophilum]
MKKNTKNINLKLHIDNFKCRCVELFLNFSDLKSIDALFLAFHFYIYGEKLPIKYENLRV